MIRRLIGLVFVLLVAGNSLAATTLLSDGECVARCCRPAIQNHQTVTPSRVRCHSECGEREKTAPVLTKGLIGSDYVYKAGDSGSASLFPQAEHQPLETLRTPDHCFPQYNIYLRTGSLLI